MILTLGENSVSNSHLREGQGENSKVKGRIRKGKERIGKSEPRDSHPREG